LLFPERHPLFDTDLLDHLISGQGRSLSLERPGLGFPKTWVMKVIANTGTSSIWVIVCRAGRVPYFRRAPRCPFPVTTFTGQT
jgi:hypothetical protein